MKRLKTRLRSLNLGGATWRDPKRIGQYLAVCFVYFLGLLTFIRYTGLLGDLQQQDSTHTKGSSSHIVYSSDQVKDFLRESSLNSERNPEMPLISPLFRHLLQDSVINTSATANASNSETQQDPLFPEDVFSVKERHQGAVILHIIGLIYMFVALAIVCDEFFVPSLDVIIDVIGCSEDVAGATFMAAGGSAPELFTSVIGVFVAFSDVGIGTIVGSAVFNILFVIGMCALFSKTVLHLTWWPLFRDCTFYSISLITLIIFFRDEKITWYEALLQLLIYAAYVGFMKYNAQAERFIKKLLYKNKVTRVRSTDHLVPTDKTASPNEPHQQPSTSAAVLDPKPLQVGQRAHHRRVSIPAAVHVLHVYRGSFSSIKEETELNVDKGRKSVFMSTSRSNQVIPESQELEPAQQHHSAAAALAGVTGAAMSGVVAGETKSHPNIPVLHSGTHFRHGLLQLMIHTIDPLHDGKVDEKATQLHAIASLKVLLDATKPQDGINGTTGNMADGNITGDQTHDSGRASQGTEVTHVDALTNADQLSQTGQHNGVALSSNVVNVATVNQQPNGASAVAAAAAAAANGHQQQNVVSLPTAGGEDSEDDNQPLDLSWPETWRERLTYLIFLPIIIPLWLTLPDTRKASARKYYPVTFLGSIFWIAAFSYLMVWWATVTGDTFSIPPPVMGLTFLAAGTSIPDLITSVIVARKGFGDMAVSSSVGSNIFDVTVGLPLPWLLFTIISAKPISVSATGMVCSIAILFGMLCLVFFSILIFNWKMTKGMGFSMFLLYFVFVAVSLGFEYNLYRCPI